MLSPWLFGTLLISLRIAPALALAPPFSLLRVPRLFRLLLALSLAALMVSTRRSALLGIQANPAFLVPAALCELTLGIVFLMILQLAFGAIYLAGRTVDIQGGFGFSLLVDPTSSASTPLVGTFLALLAGMFFFAAGGLSELLRIFAGSIDSIPIGSFAVSKSIGPLLDFLSVTFIVALGATGGVILSLFLTDLAIAMLSRTVPQMNVLLLGFQVKAIVILVALPMTLGLSAAVLARVVRIALSALAGPF